MLRQPNQNLEIRRSAGEPLQRGMLDFRPRRLHKFCGAVQVVASLVGVAVPFKPQC